MANTKITTDVIADGAITSAKLDTNITISGNITGTLATASQPNITSVGTLTGFTSTGIDDNADATAITIDSDENVLIGKTSNTISAAGAKLGTGGSNFTRDNSEVVYVNRTTSDGSLITLAKDGTTVGSIGSDGGSLVIGGGDVGIGFYQNADALVPINGGTRALRDSAIDLGLASGGKFKDLYLSGAIYSGSSFTINEDGGGTYLGKTNNTSLRFITANAERMRIDNTGNLIVGKTSTDFNTAGFHVTSGAVYSGIQTASASSTYHVRDTTNNTWEFYVTGTGQIHATSTSITSLSDERLKENIKDLETGLTEVMELKPRRFDWKNKANTNVAGFIAQEVETVLPDLIGDFKHEELEDAKSVKMGDMIPTLVKAIQEQQTQIETLKQEIREIKG